MQAQQQKLEYEVARLVQSHIATAKESQLGVTPVIDQPILQGITGGLTTSLMKFSLNSTNEPPDMIAMTAGIPLSEALSYLNFARSQFTESEIGWSIFLSVFDDWAKDRT